MKPEDKKRFSSALTRVKVSLPGLNLTTKEEVIRMDVFWEALLPYSIEHVEFAFRRAEKELTFFPKPAEIISFILENQKQGYLEGKVKENTLIEWMLPTEEGREKAIKLIDDLKAKWGKEDEERETKGKIEFEKKREKLKKQAKLYER